jgi:hypothetical protein
MELNRRSLLKILGVGSCAMFLGMLNGCAMPVAFTSIPERKEVTGFGLGRGRLDKGLVQATMNEWKRVLRALYNLENISTRELVERVSRAKRMTLQVIDHIDEIGLSTKVDAILRDMPRDIILPKEIVQKILIILQDAFPGREIRRLKDELAVPLRKPHVQVLELVKEHGSHYLEQQNSKTKEESHVFDRVHHSSLRPG